MGTRKKPTLECGLQTATILKVNIIFYGFISFVGIYIVSNNIFLYTKLYYIEFSFEIYKEIISPLFDLNEFGQMVFFL